jgi:hypothetical protein
MLVRHQRLAVAGVIAATAIVVPTAALASGSDSPSGKGAPPQVSVASASASAPAAKKSAAAAGKSAAGSQLATLAASAGISTDRLQAGLMAAKRAGGNTAAGITAFAASARVSRATAQRIVHAALGTQVDEGRTVPAAASAFATRLGVGTSAAGPALKQLAALQSTGGVDPASSAFATIAHDLGVSPARLAAAWNAVKPSVAGK